MIEAVGLGKIYEGCRAAALSDFDLQCRAGEVVGLLGPNGAGKTTALRILSTAVAPTFGRARVGGHDIRTDARAVRRSVGFLSGDTGLYGRLTAEETLRFFARLFGIRGHQLSSRVAEIAALLDLSPFLRTRCDRLSSGQRQRVSIARTIVHDPPILILDEATAGLDVLSSRTIISFIKRCRDRGRAVLFSTHILSEAERLCDRIVLLHQGKPVFGGTTSALKTQTGAQTLEDAFLSLIAGAES